MRARNREINIFNMSLLDILTGMLGAFLFLMLALVPYYSRASKGKTISAEEQKQFDELKKLLEKGMKGPLTAEEAEKLRTEMDRLNNENQQLQGQNSQLQAQNTQLQSDLQGARQELSNTKQELSDTTKDRDFWKSQDAILTITTWWNSEKVDIDVMVLAPDGMIYSPKKEKLFGRDTTYDGSDSHGATHGGTYAAADEGLVVYLSAPGDYLVFYRVPRDAKPADYADLHGSFVYKQELADQKAARITEFALGPSNATKAKPGGMYAWVIINYDPDKQLTVPKWEFGKLPPGITVP